MEKRIFLAVLISIAFLWAWGALIPRLFPELAPTPPEQTTTQRSSQPELTPAPATPAAAATPPGQTVSPSPAASQAASAPVAAVQASTERVSVVETPQYIARFSNRGAQLVSFQLKGYDEEDGKPVDLVKSRPAGSTDFPFAIETSNGRLTRLANSALHVVDEKKEGEATTLQYRYVSPEGAEVRKTFRLGPSYLFEFDISVTPRVPYRVVLGPGIRTIDPGSQDTQFITTGNGVVQIEDSLDVVAREKAAGFEVFDEPVDYIGIEDNYFLIAVKPQVASNTLFRSVRIPFGSNPEETRKELYAGINALDGRVRGSAFFGPKQADILEAYGLERALKFGWFGLIGRFLLTALIWIYGFVGNYGWAIVLLTVVIKIILYPLQHKAIVSMKKMQKVQPKVNALKDKYKKAKTDAEQRQKMNMEMMKLYQQEGINPMSGCLPILLQLPILWAFYGLLSNAIELRGAEFMGWINDLSAPDPYYLTPILMTATMFIQQWMTPTTLDPVQRRIFMILPLVFGFIFKDFPSGLVLYWLVQNVLTIIQQAIMNRYWKDHPLEVSK